MGMNSLQSEQKDNRKMPTAFIKFNNLELLTEKLKFV